MYCTYIITLALVFLIRKKEQKGTKRKQKEKKTKKRVYIRRSFK